VKNGVLDPNFNSFMANSVHANWIFVHIVYSSSDPSEPIVDKEHICYFHWT